MGIKSEISIHGAAQDVVEGAHRLYAALAQVAHRVSTAFFAARPLESRPANHRSVPFAAVAINWR
jgi:hypothetical protein